MISDTLPAGRPGQDAFRLRDVAGDRWPLLLGLLVLGVPTLVNLGRQAWSTESGAHGPIVLATGIWLLVHNGFRASAGGAPARDAPWLVPVAVLAWALYAFGRAYDYLSLEAGGLYVAALVAAVLAAGVAEVRRNLFPFFYLAFVIPPPGWLIDRITAPLQTFVSYAAVHLLQPFGYPIVREGVALMIGPYQLLVEEACAGMNSLIGLTAISLFYIYLLHRASWRYALVLVALILPVAVFVNMLRVIALVLITHYLGDAAAQGALHVTTGMVLFTVAIAITFLIDKLLQAAVGARRRRRAAG